MCVKSFKNTVFDPESPLIELHPVGRMRDADKDLRTRMIPTASFVITKNGNNPYAQQKRHSYINYSVFVKY